MKNILYLFLAVTMFACSSDSSDTNDNSNQTFLERFEGVVWQSEATEVDAFLIFDNDNYSAKWVINGDCLVWYFDVYNENIETSAETTKAKGTKCPVCWKITEKACSRHSE